MVLGIHKSREFVAGSKMRAASRTKLHCAPFGSVVRRRLRRWPQGTAFRDPDPAAKSTGGVDQAKMQAIEKARVKAKAGLKAQKAGGINASPLRARRRRTLHPRTWLRLRARDHDKDRSCNQGSYQR